MKTENNAVILAHNYQRREVRENADHVGDSLELSIRAAHTTADVIVFCGVRFMAETAGILSPGKTVLLPDMRAGCPMADMIRARQLEALKQSHKQAVVLCYVNTPAEVKAQSDICCTSSNAVRIVETKLAHSPEIIFVPDKFLARNTTLKTGREFITWPGYCPTHAKILPEHIIEARRRHPGARVMVHPECRPEACAHADAVLSTGQMCSYAKENTAREFIVGTEKEMCSRLSDLIPAKQFYPVADIAVCPSMKRITLQTVYNALKDMTCKIELPDTVIRKARKSIERMISISTPPDNRHRAGGDNYGK